MGLLKLYVCGLPSSGKGYLTQLLDGHENLEIFPYHKFGISGVLKEFKIFMKKNHFFDEFYFSTDNSLLLKIKFPDEGSTREISISKLIYFIFRFNKSFPYLLQSHISKFAIAFAGDKHFVTHKINFDLNNFIQNIILFIKEKKNHIFLIEELDDIINDSYVKSLDNKHREFNKLKYFVQWGDNSTIQLRNLSNYYKKFKVIFVKRDLIATAYSRSLREYSRKYKTLVNIKSNALKEFMYEAILNAKKNERSYYSKISKYDKDNKFSHYSVNFNELISDKKKCMKNICNFLDIEFNDILLEPFFLNIKIENQFFNSNKVNDDPNTFFTRKELDDYKFLSRYKVLLLFFLSMHKLKNYFNLK